MLTVNGLKEFYFLPRMYDMRCGYHRIMEIIKTRHGRRPEDGEVFFFMSKDMEYLKAWNWMRYCVASGILNGLPAGIRIPARAR